MKAIRPDYRSSGLEAPLRQAKTGGNPPPDLGAVGRALWEEIMRDHALCDDESLKTLTQACRSLDLAEQCRAQIAVDGLIMRTKSGCMDHPLVMREVSAIAFCILSLERFERPAFQVGSSG